MSFRVRSMPLRPHVVLMLAAIEGVDEDSLHGMRASNCYFNIDCASRNDHGTCLRRSSQGGDLLRIFTAEGSFGSFSA
jgi:hypothetical protein